MQETIVAEGKADKKKFDWCAAERAKSKESKSEKDTQIGSFKAVSTSALLLFVYP